MFNLSFFRKHKRKITFFLVCMQVMMLSFAVCASAADGDGETTDPMQTLVDAIDFVWAQFTKMAELVTSKPILLLPVAIFAAGAAIGLVKRLIS